MSDFSSAMDSQISAARLTQTPRLPTGAGLNMAKIKETAQEFEAVFLSEMLRPMFSNIDAAEPFGGGNGEKMYRDMQVDEYGKSLAKSGGIGLADQVMREMIKMQEAKHGH